MVSILKRIRKSSLSGSLSSSAPRHESKSCRNKEVILILSPSELLEDSGPGEVDPIVEGVQFKVVFNLSKFMDTQVCRVPCMNKGEIPWHLPGDI